MILIIKSIKHVTPLLKVYIFMNRILYKIKRTNK